MGNVRRAILAVILAAVLAGGCGIEGLHNANPATDFRIDPQTGEIKYRNNKDVDFGLESGSYTDASGRKVDLKGLELRSNASDVRRVNGEWQMPGMAMQATANWAGGAQFVGAVSDLLADVLPFVPKIQAAAALSKMPQAKSVTTPWGGLQTSAGLTAEQMAALERIAGTAIDAPAVAAVPAGSPGPATPPASVPASVLPATLPAGLSFE
jgi:hypothetical protein